ncbi:MAG: PD-(D/E)XK nuclease family protein [Candidatus Thorarchaeota archaeon]|nr:PD-(D/E)XK nuclease family protein [Candidatus Thorarchaeota archaeon]
MEQNHRIVAREYTHSSVPYHFRWSIVNHQELGNTKGDLAALWALLEAVRDGTIPTEPFTSPFFARASSLGFEDMSKAQLVGLRKRLMKKGQLVRDLESELVGEIRDYHRQIGDDSYRADHSILQEFLRRDSNAIAIEVPVWSMKHSLSGHIDLIRFGDEVIQVCDYKPGPLHKTAQRFTKSIPQVAAYGEMMAQRLAVPLREALDAAKLPAIECCIFDTHSCWRFGAELFVNLWAAQIISGV